MIESKNTGLTCISNQCKTDSSFQDIDLEDSPIQEKVRPQRTVMSNDRKSTGYFDTIKRRRELFLGSDIDSGSPSLIDYGHYSKWFKSSGSKSSQKAHRVHTSVKVRIKTKLEFIPIKFNDKWTQDIQNKLRKALNGGLQCDPKPNIENQISIKEVNFDVSLVLTINRAQTNPYQT